MSRLLLSFLPLLLAACASHDPKPDKQAAASVTAELPDWSVRELPGKRQTRYGLANRAGRACLLAEANQSASLLRRPLDLDPQQLGRVEFDWWIAPDALLGHAAHEEPLDDAPARLVLAFGGEEGRLSMRNRMLFELARTLTGEAPPYATLMYVWDAKAEPESVIVNAHSDRIRKIVVGSGRSTGAWKRFSRDIASDFRKAFGEEPGRLVQAAVMTDADNTKSRTEACYGRLQFLDPQQRELPGGMSF
ncbi:DUF3047 domain-containing protein [Pelomonas sp. SE-A7]|uniref:DUF3047 domain-containing protein n=1 Tax=Pelomonas sp. SE-A7 TaxID=3054953 RepID=UPI00259CEA4C|nr:DUF3047 domain-containing protein [Pelomonas sp. SE-A7]MDM4767736.1 DUF3047 domain-containing protein [Pelomonas sp. SE-A7]